MGDKMMMLECPDHKLNFLDSGLTKPHHYISQKVFKSSQNFIGKIPDIEFFYPDGMPSSEKKDFLKWYEEIENVSDYDFNEQMKIY